MKLLLLKDNLVEKEETRQEVFICSVHCVCDLIDNDSYTTSSCTLSTAPMDQSDLWLDIGTGQDLRNNMKHELPRSSTINEQRIEQTVTGNGFELDCCREE